MDSPSPFMNWLKPKMLQAEMGRFIFQYEIRKEMTNPFGILHGGVTAAMIDDAIGATLICFNEPFNHLSINIAVDYFSSAKEYDIVIAETSIIKKGNTIVNAQCEVWNETRDRLLARGYTNLLKIPLNV